jgi:hypothetical protein
MYYKNYVLFGYYMNKSWIFKVLVIASPKAWIGSTKIIIKHDLQLKYISRLLHCVFSSASLVLCRLAKCNNPSF